MLALRQFGKKKCPACGMSNKTARMTCGKCGYRYSAAENEDQLAFEARTRRRTALVCVAILIPAALLWVISEKYGIDEPAVSSAQQDFLPGSRLLARATAGAAVKERMSNPASFDLVDATANEGKADDGSPAWIVGIAYRGTNAFGGVVTGHAIVTVDRTGQTPLGIVDLD